MNSLPPAGDCHPSSYQFSKQQRLLSSSQFQFVFNGAQWRLSHHNILILARNNAIDEPRLGLVIAKKHIRRAVDRNRVKRLIRESFRHQQHQLPAIDAIVLARKGMGELSNDDLLSVMNKLWYKLQKKIITSNKSQD